MKNVLPNKLIFSSAVLLSLFSLSASAEEYQLTAFSDTIGFRALVKEDVERVQTTFETRSTEYFDYFEMNNLCVAQILLDDAESAISSCEAAVEKAEHSLELTFDMRRKALASVHSNLGVAKAMSGDMTGANTEFETALSLNEADRNAQANYSLVDANLLAGS